MSAAWLGATQLSPQHVCCDLPNLLPPTQGAVGWDSREAGAAGHSWLHAFDGWAASVGIDV